MSCRVVSCRVVSCRVVSCRVVCVCVALVPLPPIVSHNTDPFSWRTGGFEHPEFKKGLAEADAARPSPPVPAGRASGPLSSGFNHPEFGGGPAFSHPAFGCVGGGKSEGVLADRGPQPESELEPEPELEPGPEPQQADTTLIHCTFTKAGSLGMKLNSTAEGAVIVRVNPGSQAEDHAQLRAGLLIRRIGDKDVTGVDYAGVLSVIKQAKQRPVTVSFVSCEPRASTEPADAQPRTVKSECEPPAPAESRTRRVECTFTQPGSLGLKLNDDKSGAVRASLALAPLPLICSYKSEKSLCGTAGGARQPGLASRRS